MLYIIRHGRTDWNDQRRLQGRTDIPLNERGIAMAKAAAAQLEGIHLDVCYCSPLIRAKRTAELLLEGRNIPIIPDERLLEISFGRYEGIADPESLPDSPIRAFFAHPEAYVPDGGAESLDSLFRRTGDFLQSTALPLVRQGKDVLIAGHGAMNSSIVCQIRSLPRAEFWSAGLENCKVIRLI